MGNGVTELKREVMLREWSARIAECRNSGKAVKEWCAEQGISVQTYYRWEKRFVEKATQQLSQSALTQTGKLMQVNPEALPSGGGATSDRVSPSAMARASFFFPSGAARKPSPTL